MKPLGLSDWPRIKAGLEVLLSKSGQAWIPEDVYSALSHGEAYCFEIGTGFAVVQVSRYLRGQMLFVWILYMPRGNKPHPVIDALDALAKQSNCNLIRYHSSRNGWERLTDGAFEPVCVVYERNVNG